MQFNFHLLQLFASALLVLFAVHNAHVVASLKPNRFHGYRLYQATPFTSEAVKALQKIHDDHPAETEDGNVGLIFMEMPSKLNRKVQILVPPAKSIAFESNATAIADLLLQLLHADYYRILVESERPVARSRWQRQRRSAATAGLTLDHSHYRSYSQINSAMVKLRTRCNELQPGTCQIKNIGASYEKRDLYVLQIKKRQADKQKQRVWIDGGIHAREWISPATVLYMADVLISHGLNQNNMAASREVQHMLDYYDFHILILYNPDGYQFTRTHNRLWRKNRQIEYKSGRLRRNQCLGVDLNRNYGFKWGGQGSSKKVCADNYRGRAAFSAEETVAVRNYLSTENAKARFLLFLSFHSFGQFILLPFGYETGAYPKPVSVERRMRCAAYKASIEMFRKNNRFYVHGTSADVLYTASGGSDDWAHGSLQIPYSMTVELPDDGAYGFLLPAAYIVNVGQESVTGLAAMLKAIRGLETNANYYQANCPELVHGAA